MAISGDAAWLSRHYNNRAHVPEFEQILKRWAASSAQVRAQLKGELGVRYMPGDGGTLDVFAPSAAKGPSKAAASAKGGAPVLLFIHGGYWRSLSKDDFSFIAPAFTRAGALVVVPDYALCPAVSIEHISMQMVQAVGWCLQNAARYGGDASRITVIGHSAGGHLASMMVSCHWTQAALPAGPHKAWPPKPVSGAMSISGLFDLEPLRQVDWLQPDLRLTPASVAKLSSAFFPKPATSDGAPLYACVGGAETEAFIGQNQLIREAWGSSRVPVCIEVPRRNHFDVLDELASEDGQLFALSLELMGLHA